MPRLRNEVTGAVMSVSEALAARLGSEWVPPVEQSEPDAEPKKRGRSRRAESNE